jgi:hypothetical protein
VIDAVLTATLVVIGTGAVAIGALTTGLASWAALFAGACLVGYVLGIRAR